MIGDYIFHTYHGLRNEFVLTRNDPENKSDINPKNILDSNVTRERKSVIRSAVVMASRTTATKRKNSHSQSNQPNKRVKRECTELIEDVDQQRELTLKHEEKGIAVSSPAIEMATKETKSLDNRDIQADQTEMVKKVVVESKKEEPILIVEQDWLLEYVL